MQTLHQAKYVKLLYFKGENTFQNYCFPEHPVVNKGRAVCLAL
jgi:hypothetical protein